MFINYQFLSSQQQRIQKYAKNNDSYNYFNLLTSPEPLSTVEKLLPEHQEQLYLYLLCRTYLRAPLLIDEWKIESKISNLCVEILRNSLLLRADFALILNILVLNFLIHN